MKGRRVFREVPLLMKVGLIMTLALALLIGAVVVSVALRSDPERLVAAEVATNSAGQQAPRFSSGKQGSATKTSSSQKEFVRSSSGEQKKEKESLRYGSSSSSSGGPVEQRKEEANEPQALLQQQEEEQAQHSNPQSATSQLAGGGGGQSPSEASSGLQPQPQKQHHQPHQQEQLLPGAEGRGWAEPTQTELNTAKGERHYQLLPGAIMGLTIEAMGIYDAPVFDSFGRWALANGVAHNPQTSLPWSPTPQRNVYLAGHRMGYRGTWSRMLFYNLDKLKEGDKVVLKDRAGTTYRYRVREVFKTDPTDVWVMGQVRGRDMVTLQTCTPIPTFEKRLIVRAERV
jgi:LPXTG-site transpeptidase (sortase) family protein